VARRFWFGSPRRLLPSIRGEHDMPLRFEPEKEGSFYEVVKQRIEAYLASAHRSPLAGGLLLVKALVLISLMVGSYAAVLAIGKGWVLLPLGVVFAVSALLLAINVGHDASHDAVFRSPRLNLIVQRACFLPTGINGYLWRMRHLNSHHLFPNVNGSDTDIDENPVMRLSPNQPWRWHFQFQHLYGPFMYLFAATHTTWWGDFVYLFKKKLANMIDIKHPWYEYVLFFVAKLAYVTIVLVIPILVLDIPWWQVVLGYLFVKCIASFVFVFLLIGTHFSDLADFPVPDPTTGSVGRTWAEHNMATACDWSPHNRLAHLISGGVNAHASHHLFPEICHTHYPQVARIIEKTAEEFGVPYHRVSMWGMVRSHLRFLYQLGRRPSVAEPAKLGAFARESS
jgi:linoleoyl-CoA desaturase